MHTLCKRYTLCCIDSTGGDDVARRSWVEVHLLHSRNCDIMPAIITYVHTLELGKNWANYKKVCRQNC